jgi:hypothetical protein
VSKPLPFGAQFKVFELSLANEECNPDKSFEKPLLAQIGALPGPRSYAFAEHNDSKQNEKALFQAKLR